jgi:hypothetical protein
MRSLAWVRNEFRDRLLTTASTSGRSHYLRANSRPSFRVALTGRYTINIAIDLRNVAQATRKFPSTSP